MGAWVNAIATAVISAAILIVLAVACQLLPNSPFQSFIGGEYFEAIAPYLSAIRFFLPIDEMILILETWVAVITEYWIWKIVYSVTKSVASSGTSIIPMK